MYDGLQSPGRNDECWCGSGKKYKKCHLDFDERLEELAEAGEEVPPRDLLKTPAEIEGIKRSAEVNIGVLDYVAERIAPGVTTEQIDQWVHDYTVEHGAIPAPLADRMDVITLISKRTDSNGKLPGEYGSELEDLPVGEEGYSNPNPFCADGPRQDEFLAEMRREVFEGREGFLTVGEAPGVTAQRNEHITDPGNGELDMLFLFEHVDFDCEGTKWKPLPLDLPKFKSIMAGYQTAVQNAGWASLFTGNHDQPRVVSRWGDDSAEESRVRSAKALGLMLHMHRGTPYIYQGEELGMTDAHFTRLDQYRDLESLNAYRQRVEEAKVQSSESMMAGLAARSRDNARTPMQWDGSGYAGFTAPDAATEPWISVNPNHAEINAAGEFDDPDSVYSFYKQLVALRHNSPVVAAGDWRLIDAADPHVYAFTRELDAEKLLVVVNMSSRTVDLPREAAELTAVGIAEPNVVISTYDAPHTVASLANRELDPWEAAVIQL